MCALSSILHVPDMRPVPLQMGAVEPIMLNAAVLVTGLGRNAIMGSSVFSSATVGANDL